MTLSNIMLSNWSISDARTNHFARIKTNRSANLAARTRWITRFNYKCKSIIVELIIAPIM